MNHYILRVEVFQDVIINVYHFDLRINAIDITRDALRLKSIFGKSGVRVFVYDFEKLDYKNLFSLELYELPSFIINEVGKKTEIVEIGFLPGVTDGEAGVIRRLVNEVLPLWENLSVYSGKMFASDNFSLPRTFNKLVNYGKLISYTEKAVISVRYICPFFCEQSEFKKLFHVPIVLPEDVPLAQNIGTKFFALSDDNLLEVGDPLGLSVEEMKSIKLYIESDKIRQSKMISDIELEAIAQSWSEHCCHKIFSSTIDGATGIFQRYIKGATKRVNSPECVSVFSDNAGAIVFDDDFLIVEKVETHNSPSALDPFGGAMTGILGVNRDILGFGLGAKPVMNSYYFCFAENEEEKLYRKVFDKSEPVLSPKFVHDGVISGVNVGGNCSGIPTMHGGMYFHSGFRGKPLVFVGCSGLIPRHIMNSLSHVKSAEDGNLIVLIGGSTGLDGIHGATFSSAILGDNVSSSVVQIGDPFVQKKLIDAIIAEARDLGLYNSITDNGAGGLSSSVGEMGRDGFSVDLDFVPLKESRYRISPWQIWVSESQERMTLSVPEDKYTQLKAIMDKHEVQIAAIGRFNRTGRGVVRCGGDVIMDLDMSFLHNGRPIEELYTSLPSSAECFTINKMPMGIRDEILHVLSAANISSMEYIVSQYDHEVQGSSVLKPIQGIGRVCSETIAFRPVLSSKKCVIRSSALGSAYGEVDVYRMTACAIDHAIRNCIAAGANITKLAMLDNFCWSNSRSRFRLWELERAAKACYDYAVAFGVPFVSGKDSMFNDFIGYRSDSDKQVTISAPPSILISTFGVVDDFYKCKSIDAKSSGDVIYLIGTTLSELCCSEYQKQFFIPNSRVPFVDANKALARYKLYNTALEFISSAIPVNLGGLAVALAKKLMSGRLGANVDLLDICAEYRISERELLFSESQSRILVTVPVAKACEFEKCFQGDALFRIGVVTETESLNIEKVANLSICEMLEAYKARSNNELSRYNA